jgi:hypothetical protein
VVDVGVPCQRDQRVDIEQRHCRRSVLVERAPDGFQRDRRRAGRHTDNRQPLVRLDTRRREATARQPALTPLLPTAIATDQNALTDRISAE